MTMKGTGPLCLSDLAARGFSFHPDEYRRVVQLQFHEPPSNERQQGGGESRCESGHRYGETHENRKETS